MKDDKLFDLKRRKFRIITRNQQIWRQFLFERFQLGQLLYIYIMSKPFYSQLQFYIKLTDIIGRTFNDIQSLLKQQLNQQIPTHDPKNPFQNVTMSIKKTHNQNHQSGGKFIFTSSKLTDQHLPDKIESHKSKDLNNGQIQQARKKQAYTDDSHVAQKGAKATERNESQLKIYQTVDSKIAKGRSNNQNDEQEKRGNVKKLQKIKKVVKSKFRHQNFNQQSKKATKKKSVRLKKKDYAEGRPYPPLNAFMIFLLQNKHEIMRQKPQLSPSEVSIYASTVWKNMEAQQKEQYLQAYRKNQDNYLEQLRKYEQKQKQQKLKRSLNEDSNFHIEKGKEEENIDIELRANLRTRKNRKKQSNNEIICVQSEQNGNQNEEDCEG